MHLHYMHAHLPCHCMVQWNPSIAATLGEQHLGCYIGVAFIEGLFCKQTFYLGPGCLADILQLAFIQEWPLRGVLYIVHLYNILLSLSWFCKLSLHAAYTFTYKLYGNIGTSTIYLAFINFFTLLIIMPSLVVWLCLKLNCCSKSLRIYGDSVLRNWRMYIAFVTH